jgi:hypothetical protein
VQFRRNENKRNVKLLKQDKAPQQKQWNESSDDEVPIKEEKEQLNQ